MNKFAAVTAIFLLTLLSMGVAVAQEEDRTDWPETFIVGVYPGDNVEEALAAVEPLRIYLEERLGVRTVLITGTSYNAVIEAMRAGRADAMEVGPFAYVLAAQEANAEAIAILQYDDELNLDNAEERIDVDLIPGYYSLLFTVKGSGIRSIADLEGRSFAFSDPASTSGYLVPATAIMVGAGLDGPAALEDFANVVFSGNHPAAVLSVAQGTTDAGATFDANLPAQAREGLIELCGFDLETGEFPYLDPMSQEEVDAIYDECPEGNVVVFAQTTVIPETPFAVRGDLPESFKEAVQVALFDVANQPELAAELRRYYVDPREALGVETYDAIFDGLRDTARLLELDLGS
jgi:phosphonate transport system substrate-binding protein